jgi:hypothetical protein
MSLGCGMTVNKFRVGDKRVKKLRLWNESEEVEGVG